MKEITIEERKTISLEILSEIHDFCEKNNICYFLDYGTLLGAVRHKGYIPWDDDIDISMKRDDYERFLKTFCSSKYEIANYRDKKFFAIQFSKVYDKKTFGILLDKINLNYGVAVDVFPLDEIPEQDNEQKVILRKIKHVDRFYLKSLFCQNFVRIESIKDIVKLIELVGTYGLDTIDNALNKLIEVCPTNISVDKIEFICSRKNDSNIIYLEDYNDEIITNSINMLNEFNNFL